MKEEILIEKIKLKVEKDYGNDLLFALVFGSRGRSEGRNNSDFDLMVVEKTPFPVQKRIQEMRKYFIEIQESAGLEADHEYPGEFINYFALEKAIQGYGFVRNDFRVLIPEIGPKDWDSFNEYRQWLCAMAGPNRFIAGDKQLFHKYQERALKTVIKLLICDATFTFKEPLELVEILCNRGKEFLGMCDTPANKSFLSKQLPSIVDDLSREGTIVSSQQSYRADFDKCIGYLPLLKTTEEYNLQKKFFGESGQLNTNFISNIVTENCQYVSSVEKTINYTQEKDIVSKFTQPLPTNGSPLNEVIHEFKDSIREGNINQWMKSYIAFPDSGNSLAGLTADLYASILNQNLIATTKSAPTGTFAEIQVINWFRQLFGLKVNGYPNNALETGGICTLGGVLSNTIGLLAAREKAFPESRKKGMSYYKQTPLLFVPGKTINHYSHIASFWWLGLGEENIVEIDIDANYRMDKRDLVKKLEIYTNDPKYKVVAIVAQAGDSRTTTIEHFKEVAELAQTYQTWLHVDACHGGVLIFSEKYKHKLDGISAADSISIDPHKGLWVSYPCSLILFKNIEDLARLAKSTDITIRKGSYDLGQITPFIGSKPFMTMKLWFMMKHLGLEEIGKLVEYRFDLASNWRERISESQYFTSLNKVELNSVVFSCAPEKIKKVYPNKEMTIDQICEINKYIHDTSYQEGHICIHNFDIIDYCESLQRGKQKVRVLGVIFGNPLTEAADFSQYIAYLDGLVEQHLS